MGMKLRHVSCLSVNTENAAPSNISMLSDLHTLLLLHSQLGLHNQISGTVLKRIVRFDLMQFVFLCLSSVAFLSGTNIIV